MAVLVLLAGTARTRVIATNLLVHVDRSLRLLLAVGREFAALSPHITHILTLWSLGRTSLTVLPQRNECPEKERKHILVEFLKHSGEEVVTLKLVDNKRILLLVGRVLHALADRKSVV